MFKVAVCVKQVPLIEDVAFDSETNRIRRDGPNVISAFDLRAIALAVDFKSRFEAETVVATMGPPQAREAIISALAMGIDRGVHLEDRAFAGADTLATARVLATWLQTEDFDLILTGKYSLDAETGQVGPQIAELLGIGQITGVRRVSISGGTIYAERETDEGFDEVECRMPALLTCSERLIAPIKVKAESAPTPETTVSRINAAELKLDIGSVGFTGSPTRVGKIRISEKKKRVGMRIEGAPFAAAAEIVALIEQTLAGSDSSSCPDVKSIVRCGNRGRDVWMMCETQTNGDITPVTLELASRGATLAEQVNGALVALVIGSHAAKHKAVLESFGVDELIVVDVPAADAYCPVAVTDIVAPLIQQHCPWAFLIPATERGRDWAPRLAARLELGLTGDAVDLDVNGSNELIALKPAFGGSLLAEIYSRTYPQMATVRPGMLGLCMPCGERSARVTIVRPRIASPLTVLKAAHVLTDSTIRSLDQAQIVFGLGMGIGGREAIAAVAEIARTTGASVCATRKVTDKGWLPRQLQVGLTGKGIRARLYIAFGIRGSPNHTVGLKNVGTIVAINNDPDAPIFQSADIAIVGDCEAILAELLSVVRHTAFSPESTPCQRIGGEFFERGRLLP